jgi:hypothetical protein
MYTLKIIMNASYQKKRSQIFCVFLLHFQVMLKLVEKMTGMNPVFQNKNSLEKSIFCSEISLKFLVKIKFFEIVFRYNLFKYIKRKTIIINLKFSLSKYCSQLNFESNYHYFFNFCTPRSDHKTCLSLFSNDDYFSQNMF